jgi:hypothetical protein
MKELKEVGKIKGEPIYINQYDYLEENEDHLQ